MRSKTGVNIAGDTFADAERLLDIARDINGYVDQVEDDALRHNLRDKVRELIELSNSLSSISTRMGTGKY